MKLNPPLLAIIASCLISGPIFAAGHLTATLAPTNAGESSVVDLTITNDGDKPVAIYKSSIPTQLRYGSRLPRKLYAVSEVSTNGEREIAYNGVWIHPLKIDDSQFMIIEPGKSFKTSYDLSADYPVQSGKTYHVFYDSYIDAAPMGLDGKLIPTQLPLGTQKKLTSNVLNITPAKILSAKKVSTATSYPPVTDPDHLSILKNAWQDAAIIAESVSDEYANGAPPDYFTPNTYSVGGADYNWWFAPYNNGDANDAMIVGNINAIANRMSYQYNSVGTPTHTVAYQEGSNDCNASVTTAAVAQTGSVVTDGTYLIAICPLFYTLDEYPVERTASSQVSTLIHETSHFSDLSTDVRTSSEGGYYGDGQPWMHPTGDYGLGNYTLSGAHSLSLSDRATAVMNASNYEFYEANDPAH